VVWRVERAFLVHFTSSNAIDSIISNGLSGSLPKTNINPSERNEKIIFFRPYNLSLFNNYLNTYSNKDTNCIIISAPENCVVHHQDFRAKNIDHKSIQDGYLKSGIEINDFLNQISNLNNSESLFCTMDGDVQTLQHIEAYSRKRKDVLLAERDYAIPFSLETGEVVLKKEVILPKDFLAVYKNGQVVTNNSNINFKDTQIITTFNQTAKTTQQKKDLPNPKFKNTINIANNNQTAKTTQQKEDLSSLCHNFIQEQIKIHTSSNWRINSFMEGLKNILTTNHSFDDTKVFDFKQELMNIANNCINWQKRSYDNEKLANIKTKINAVIAKFCIQEEKEKEINNNQPSLNLPEKEQPKQI
jgi:hypothetical protein